MAFFPASRPVTRTIQRDQIQRIARTLSPDQRAVLVQVGIPAWCGLAFPYVPPSEFALDVVQSLADPLLGLVVPTSQGPRGYQLTPLGTLVAAYGLASVLPGVAA